MIYRGTRKYLSLQLSSKSSNGKSQKLTELSLNKHATLYCFSFIAIEIKEIGLFLRWD